ncbi:MAG: GNAT family N-acetyltransferase [Saprospiraceae bacterium]
MILLREANLDDLEMLKYWDKQEHVIASDPDDDWNWEYELGRKPEWREQLIAEYNGRPIGVIQIIDPAKEESHYWGNIGNRKKAIDIWIGEKNDLGKGYGTQMMTMVIDRCFANNDVDEILIDPLASNTRAIQFYKKIGFHFLENRKFGESHCAIYILKRDEWKK